MTQFARALAIAPPRTTTDGRTVTIRLVEWNTPYRVTDDGRTFYDEVFAPGGLTLPAGARAFARNEHMPVTGVIAQPGARPDRDGVLVGRIVATHHRADGLYGDVRVADNDDGRYLLGLVTPDDEGVAVLDTVSIEFDDTPQRIVAGQPVVRRSARLTGVAFTLNPQRGDARVLAVRSQQGDPTMDPKDTDTTPADEPANEPADEPANDPATEPAGVRSLPQGVSIYVNGSQQSPAPTTDPAPRRSAPEPGRGAPFAGIPETLTADMTRLHQFRSFGEFCLAAANARGDEAIEEYKRALVTGTQMHAEVRSFRRAFEVADTSDMAGLMPPQWLSSVIDLMRVNTPTVNAWDSAPLPDTGLSISQPIVTERSSVAAQANELDEPASNKVEIDTANWAVGTFAGGQGMSIQTVRRSSPDYLTQVMRIFAMEAARTWNIAVATGLKAAAAVGVSGNAALEFVDGKTFPDLVVDASALLLDLHGRPAELVGCSTGLWVELGKAKDTTGRYMFPDINPSDTVGSFTATSETPGGNIRRVTYYVDPAIGNAAAISAVIGVREAYRSMSSALATLTADVPSTLGRDVAVYQFGAHGPADASGLVLVADAA